MSLEHGHLCALKAANRERAKFSRLRASRSVFNYTLRAFSLILNLDEGHFFRFQDAEFNARVVCFLNH